MEIFWHLVWNNLTSYIFPFPFFLIPLYIFQICGVFINKVLQGKKTLTWLLMAKTMNKFYNITQFGLLLGGYLILITIIVIKIKIKEPLVIVLKVKIKVLLILSMWKTLKEVMVIMVIISFFQLFDNHDYIPKLTFF
jgi:hypothetical protein